ncbi:hypothetical protein V6N11_000248 [Hibiscus sabdariffa]
MMMSEKRCPRALDMANGSHQQDECCYFQMPLHYPRYKKSDYENMPEARLDCLLRQYGLPVIGDVEHKRKTEGPNEAGGMGKIAGRLGPAPENKTTGTVMAELDQFGGGPTATPTCTETERPLT